MIKQLVSRVFNTRNAAHKAHWKTHKYSEHVALGDFYEGLIDQIDTLVEAYQGTYGLFDLGDSEEAVAIQDICAHISDELVWITKNSKKICRDVDALENILQELQGLYMKTLYKLENLS